MNLCDNMVPSAWLYTYLKSKERFRPTAYPATADERRRGIWTKGYGHTKGVKEGDTCSLAEADELLHQDVINAVMVVRKLVHVLLSQEQFDALVSLVFNVGPEPLEKTLGRKLNAGNYEGAAAEFTRWDHQNGVWVRGLDVRRDEEAAHFRLAA